MKLHIPSARPIGNHREFTPGMPSLYTVVLDPIDRIVESAEDWKG